MEAMEGLFFDFRALGTSFPKGGGGGVMLRSAALLGNLASRDHAMIHAVGASI